MILRLVNKHQNEDVVVPDIEDIPMYVFFLSFKTIFLRTQNRKGWFSY